MKTQRIKNRGGGLILVVAGLGFVLNGLVSGPHAHWGGVFGVLGLSIAGLLLAGVGVKLINDATHDR